MAGDQNRDGQQLESSKKKVVGEPDEEKPHVRFDVAGDGQPEYGNGTEALSEEMERNGSALPKSQAPSPDPTDDYIEHMFFRQAPFSSF